MEDLFAKLSEATVHPEPYPHVIIENVLDAETCAALLREMPAMEVLTRGEAPRSNHRFSLSASAALSDPRVSPRWKDVMREGISQKFLQAVIQKFSSHIRREHPQFEASFGPLEKLEVTHRQQKERPLHAVGLDVQIAVNTPALSPGTTVRGGHLDKPDKIFTGLLYLRHEEDESTGADLELQEILPGEVVFGRSFSLPGSQVRTVRTVPYRNNTLVLFLNTPRSVHAVTARSIAAWPRYHINIVGEMREPVFSVKLDQAVEPPPSSASAPPPSLKMEPLFARCVSDQALETHPFPMLVLENVLPESLYRELEVALPECLKEGATMRIFEPAQGVNHYPSGKSASLQHALPDNSKGARTAVNLLADPGLPQVWRDFVEANLSQEALSACLKLFGAAILREYPDFEQRFGPLSSLRARRRGIDPVGPGDVELDVLIGVQTSVKEKTCAQRGPHLKKNNKVIECYLYFRPDADNGQDGAHEFFAITGSSNLPFGAGWQADPDKLELARVVPSRGNTMVAWVNTPRSIQQVAPRDPSPFALPFVELLVQLPEALFEVERLPAAGEGACDLPPTQGASGASQPAVDGVEFKSGWHLPERDGGGQFRWMGAGAPSVMEVPWTYSSPGLLQIEIRHALTATAASSLEIRVNGESMPMKLRPADHGLRAECKIASSVLQGQKSPTSAVIELHLPDLRRPSDVNPASIDSRLVGLAIGRVSLTPVSHPQGTPKEASKGGDAVMQDFLFEIPLQGLGETADQAGGGSWFRWASARQDWWIDLQRLPDGGARLGCRFTALGSGTDAPLPRVVANGRSLAVKARLESGLTVLEADLSPQLLAKRPRSLRLKFQAQRGGAAPGKAKASRSPGVWRRVKGWFKR